jgi:hypothetical protein
MDSPITRAEHEEFRRRMEEEHNRQNKRIELLEEQTEQFTDIAISVKELALSVKQMAETQKSQGEKLEKLEERDGEMWRKVVGYIVTAIVGIVIGFVFKQIGM